MIFWRRPRIKAPLVLDAHGISLGATERRAFAMASAARRAAVLKSHPENQDSFDVRPDGLYAADGITSGDDGKLHSETAIREFADGVEYAGVAEQSPKQALRTLGEIAAHTDDVLGRLGLEGGSTLNVWVRTGDPEIWGNYYAGDTRSQHNRNGRVRFQTRPQNVTVQGQELLANCFNGEGRSNMEEARRYAARTHARPWVFMDQLRLVRVRPGDELVHYSDGMKAGRGKTGTTPERIARVSAQYPTAAEAAGALVLLPETLADLSPHPETFPLALDDLLVVVGRLSVA